MLDRLTAFDRGTLDDPPSEGLISKSRAQEWGLDPVGNWASFKQDDDGTGWDLEQTRDNNKVNEITGITGGSWIVPTWDARGNMIYGPRPEGFVRKGPGP
jgi:hypothetical protein